MAAKDPKGNDPSFLIHGDVSQGPGCTIGTDNSTGKSIKTGVDPASSRPTRSTGTPSVKEDWWRSLIAPGVLAIALAVLAVLVRLDWRGWPTMVYAVFVLAFGITYAVNRYLSWRTEHWPKVAIATFLGLASVGGVLISVGRIKYAANNLDVELGGVGWPALLVGVVGAIGFAIVEYLREARHYK